MKKQTCQHWEISKRVIPKAKSQQTGQSLKVKAEGQSQDQGGVRFLGGAASYLPTSYRGSMIFHWPLEKAFPKQKVSARACERSSKRSGAGRKSSGANGAWSGHGRKWWSVSRSGGEAVEREWSGDRGYRNKFKQGATFSLVTLTMNKSACTWVLCW